ncbi:unnamed protein product [Mytilus coruscus]|uniref:Macro domain-containing protein n=1 Tax=Mytilus coruscus TaxID=42192 RepID=A0A6J8BBZ1_MYTCO|nr:unnamed protein product [Mytilus coruscus]
MSGSVTDSEACASEFDETWMPPQGELQEKYNFQWKTPWKNLNIKIRLPNGTTSEHTSFLLVPIKMQFLIKHNLSNIQRIIRSIKCSQVESINSSEELLEIKVNSLAADEIFNEIENYLTNEVDEVLLKPIQRFPYSSKLAEEYFKKGLKERSIDMMRDDSKIYIVGHLKMKDYLNKGIDKISRVTVTKTLKIDEKWKIQAIKSFTLIEILTETFPDILVRVQEGQSNIFLQGRDITIQKAENMMNKLLSDLFNQKVQFDPLVLQLFSCKQASEMLTCILQKDKLQVVWTIDKTQICFFSKFRINVNVLKSVVHENFLTAGFSNSSQQSSNFCLSKAFLEITKRHVDKLLILETTTSGTSVAATKQLILELLHREKMFYIDSRNTREVQGMYSFTSFFDEVSYEFQKINQEKTEIKKIAKCLELKWTKSEDRCKTLEIELKSEDEKYKRLAFEKHVSDENSRDMISDTTKQLKKMRDLCDVQNNMSISQQREIDNLITTNEKLLDNLKSVKDELRIQVSTVQKIKNYLDIELEEIGKNLFEVHTYIHQETSSDDATCCQKINTRKKAVVSITARTNTSVSVYLEANDHRIEQLKIQSGVEVINEEDGGMVLTGDISSIISAQDILLKWTNETPAVESTTCKISKNSQGKCDMPESNNHTDGRFNYTEKGYENTKPNRNTEGQYSRTFDRTVKPKQYNIGRNSSHLKLPSPKKNLEVGNKRNIFPNMPRNINEIKSENDWYPRLPTECENVNDEENLFPVVNIDSLMMTTKEGIKVYVYKGNLCYLDVQGIVNSSNEYMNHSSGLSSVIAKEAGKKMKDECMQYLARNTKLQQGNTCVTSAELMNVIQNALTSADENRLISVAIPAIGSGGHGGPRQVCFPSFPRAVTQFSREFGKKSSIKEVHFVDNNLEEVTLMQSAFVLAVDEPWHTRFKNNHQKTKELFFGFKRTEATASKYEELTLPNKVIVILCDGPLFSAPCHKHGEKLLDVMENTGIVITMDNILSGRSKSATTCLQRCGNDFYRSFNSLKKQKIECGKAYNIFGDIQMKCEHVICLVMPNLSKTATDKTSSEQTEFQSLFHLCCANMFKQADNCGLKHLVVPVLVDGKLYKQPAFVYCN